MEITEVRRRGATVAGMGAALTVLGTYLVGGGRTFDFDASLSVSRFVATPSLFDPFRQQSEFNNHPLFSFLEHLVYSATGSTDELLLRLVPIAASAAAVGLVVWALSRRLGVLPGLCAGLVVATNPLLMSTGREVRGYSLLTLCAVGACLLAFDDRTDRSARRGMALALVTAAGVATHLYMVFVVAILLALAWAHRRLWPAAGWLLAGSALGSLAYVFLFDEMLDTGVGGSFNPSFPGALLADLAGGQTVAVSLLVPVACLGAWPFMIKRSGLAATSAFVTMVALVWIVFAPRYLYTRFFVWALPAVGVAVAVAVARRPVLAVLVAVGAGAALFPQIVGLNDDSIPNRAMATVLATARRQGLEVCSLGWPTLALDPYITDVRRVDDLSRLQDCEVAAAVIPSETSNLVATASDRFPHGYLVGSEHQGLVFSTRPLPDQMLR